ncbi:MAG: hypothetical protein R2704_06270 [Microthrixaceae bacterium]
MENIGRGAAEMHVALGESLDSEPADGGAWAEPLLAPLHRLGSGRIRFDRLEGVLDRLRGAEDLGRSIRTHGNLHLGNISQTDTAGSPTTSRATVVPMPNCVNRCRCRCDLARLVVSLAGRPAR